MLKDFMSLEDLAELFRNAKFPARFPPASDRSAWTMESDPFRKKRFPLYVQNAEKLLEDSSILYPVLKAEDFFAYVRNGNRSIYESSYFIRRTHFSLFCMAEAVEYRGRFVPAIIEGIWQILNELVWYVPAHGRYREGDPMSRFDLPRTDLFCAQTGAILASAVQLLGQELAGSSRELLAWIREICIQRVIIPIEEERVHEWWLDGTNNWGPWCASNVAMTAFTFLQDQPERLARLILKLAATCEKFYDRYASDGGCDEGPGYFMLAGIRLMLFLDLVNTYTNGACAKIYAEEKFRNIGDYITKVHLTGPWFASMADSMAKFDQMNAGLLNHFAELSGSLRLKSFAVEAAYGFSALSEENIPDGTGGTGSFHRLVLLDELGRIFWFPKDLKRGRFPEECRTELPDLQFYVFRQQGKNEEKGTVLCIKGGHNDENHNHNDVGQFELFFNGSPVIIDYGVTDYTRFTFSEHRYENCFLNSSMHNVPAFNGVLQSPGAEFGARILSRKEDVAIEIAGAYPKESGIRSCVRHAGLMADGAAWIEDQVSGNGKITITLPLLCAQKPEVTLDGIRIGKMNAKFIGLSLTDLETIPVKDSRARLSWGNTLWCIHLGTEICDFGQWRMEFHPEDIPSSKVCSPD